MNHKEKHGVLLLDAFGAAANMTSPENIFDPFSATKLDRIRISALGSSMTRKS
jgi:hypothetical protein